MVSLGLTRVLTDEIEVVRRKRVGLITNAVACDENGTAGLERFLRDKRFRLRALFAPEHGISGKLPAGESVPVRQCDLYGIPLYYLCGRDLGPTAQMLAGLDALVFDLQDVGCRYYTYATTMVRAMETAAEAGVAFVVLDRPNPLGGQTVQGNVLDANFASSVGCHTIAIRHGMTVGEIACMFHEEKQLDVELKVVRMDGWERGMYFDDTGLPWVPPSPNLASLYAVLCYPGTCLFEGTNLSEGRGTDMPFEQIGAPWLDTSAVFEKLDRDLTDGISLEQTLFKPASSKHANEVCNGIRWCYLNREKADPVAAALGLLGAIRAVHDNEFQFDGDHFDRLAGTDIVRRGLSKGDTARVIRAAWSDQVKSFRERRDRFLLY